MRDDLSRLFESAPTRPPNAPDAQQKRSEIEVLRDRVAWLEATLQSVCDLLVDKGGLEGEALRSRLLEARTKMDAAAASPSVTCVACGKQVPREQGRFKTTGVLCATCHAETRRTRPKLRAVNMETPGRYRVGGELERPITEEIEVNRPPPLSVGPKPTPIPPEKKPTPVPERAPTGEIVMCISCADRVLLSTAHETANGRVCAKCHADLA